MNAERTPVISFIVCAYNSVSTIEKCVNSILRQTITDIELVLVDDGSTDGTSALCDSFARDVRVRVIHKPNGGVSSARNAGLAAASGQYIIWLDSDDYFEPDMGETMLAAARRHGARFAICNYINHYPSKDAPRYPEMTEDRVVDRGEMLEMLVRYMVSQSICVSIAERSLYEGIHFPNGQLFEDVRNSYKLIEGSERVVLVAKTLMHRLIREDSISHSSSIAQRLDGCRAYIDRYNDLGERWPKLRPLMLAYDFRHSFKYLRRNIIRSRYGEFRACAKDIRAVCSFYRKHSAEILASHRNIAARLSFLMLTSGTYAGFYASRMLERLAGGRTSWLEIAPAKAAAR